MFRSRLAACGGPRLRLSGLLVGLLFHVILGRFLAELSEELLQPDANAESATILQTKETQVVLPFSWRSRQLFTKDKSLAFMLTQCDQRMLI